MFACMKTITDKVSVLNTYFVQGNQEVSAAQLLKHHGRTIRAAKHRLAQHAMILDPRYCITELAQY